ncbi:MAG: cytochrome ubiquinol oxidase subunit I, partial [Phycisphaerae bacterium]|nr:cytochrome ubiquinol oxidase subunit I [Phycisphaerae bacterium]
DGVPWVVNGETLQRAVLTDFFAALLNPSTANRISHVLIGALVMGGLFVLSVSAWYLLRRKETEVFRRAFGVGLMASVIGIVGAMVTGDANARMVASLQPAKLAAMEALAVTPDGPANLTILGVPHASEGRDPTGLFLPGGLSMLVYREVPPTTNVPGLDLFAPKDRPNSGIVFWSFRAMVFAGSARLLLLLVALYAWYRGTVVLRRGLLWACVGSVLLGVVANQCGWVTAEVGRQPWMVTPLVPRVDPMAGAGGGMYLAHVADDGRPWFRVWTPGEPGAQLARDGWHVAYGHRIVRASEGDLREWREGDPASTIVYDGTTGLRTANGVSTALHRDTVATSLVMFACIYALLGVLYVVAMNHLIQRGPVPAPLGQGDSRHEQVLPSPRARKGGA